MFLPLMKMLQNSVKKKGTDAETFENWLKQNKKTILKKTHFKNWCLTLPVLQELFSVYSFFFLKVQRKSVSISSLKENKNHLFLSKWENYHFLFFLICPFAQ